MMLSEKPFYSTFYVKIWVYHPLVVKNKSRVLDQFIGTLIMDLQINIYLE
jgi:hypothetical protein